MAMCGGGLVFVLRAPANDEEEMKYRREIQLAKVAGHVPPLLYLNVRLMLIAPVKTITGGRVKELYSEAKMARVNFCFEKCIWSHV